jgi:hypothetical protein
MKLEIILFFNSKIKNLLFLVNFVILPIFGLSQPCLPEGIIFSSQAEIDSFQFNNPNCLQIQGNVTISGNDIVNLNGLNGITSIDGYLWIHDNPNLLSIAGLNSLSLIGSHLRIEFNVALPSLNGLNQLSFIGGKLNLVANTSMPNLTGLEGLTKIGGDLWIGYNTALSSLSGLSELTTIVGGLDINDDNALVNLHGFDKLDSIGGYLWIGNNTALASLSGLENLHIVGGYLFIGNDSVLINLTGLNNLITIGGHVSIKLNHSLSSLEGIENIVAGTITNLLIYSNPSLSHCAVKSICTYLLNPTGTVEIHDNLIGCNNQLEVDSTCQFLTTESLRNPGNISLYPNPASTYTTINVPDSFSNIYVTIQNTMGELLLEQESIGPQIILDVRPFPYGIYFVKVFRSSGVKCLKLIKDQN